MNIPGRLAQKAAAVDRALAKLLPGKKLYPAHLAEAMSYSVFSGGKRVRPYLVLESARVCGAREAKAMPLAAALEMIHAYSLVHDDLPAMDDDDFRRGRKTCHKQFDEATAILAGDALLTQAFLVLAEARDVSEPRRRQVISVVGRAAGAYGMVGGQAADLKHQKKRVKIDELRKINALKTGCLITAACEAGALWAGAAPGAVRRLKKYGQEVGFLFQLVDDIIDGDGYVPLLGKEKTYALAAQVRDRAKSAVKPFGPEAAELLAFADFLFERKA